MWRERYDAVNAIAKDKEALQKHSAAIAKLLDDSDTNVRMAAANALCSVPAVREERLTHKSVV